MQNLIIKNLRDCPSVIPTLANWFEREFSSEDVRASEEIEWRENSLKTHTAIPITLVAFEGDTPIGTGRLFNGEAEGMPQYTPLIGYEYVDPMEVLVKFILARIFVRWSTS